MSKKNSDVAFQFLNEKKDGKKILTLSGTVQKRRWSDERVIDASLVREAIEGETGDITIRLNSAGGDVFEGLEIYNYIKDHPSNITVEVTGLAASAATFILAGADKAIMNTGTTLMIHEASTIAWGNKVEIKKVLNALETIDKSILDIYMEQTGQSAEQITEWVNSEKWFTADEAVQYGFADEVKKEPTTSNSTGNINIANLTKEITTNVLEQIKNQSQQKPENPPKTKQKSLLNKLKKGE
jgi:Protease subunit of ATP-dependent Clp proteases